MTKPEIEEAIKYFEASLMDNECLSISSYKTALACLRITLIPPLSRTELVGIIQNYSDRSCCVTCKKCTTGIADAILKGRV